MSDNANKRLCVCLAVMFASLSGASAQENRGSVVVFRVVDEFGSDIQGVRVKGFGSLISTQSKATGVPHVDYASVFTGLKATEIPYGNYIYGIERPNPAGQPQIIQGYVSVLWPEVVIVVPVTRQIPFAPISVDGGVSDRSYFMEGHLTPPGRGRDPGRPLWIRLSPLYEKESIDVPVDEMGRFRIHRALTGRYLLTVMQNDKVLTIRQLQFDRSLPRKEFTVRLEQGDSGIITVGSK